MDKRPTRSTYDVLLSLENRITKLEDKLRYVCAPEHDCRMDRYPNGSAPTVTFAKGGSGKATIKTKENE